MRWTGSTGRVVLCACLSVFAPGSTAVGDSQTYQGASGESVSARSTQAPPSLRDEYQRSVEILEFKTTAKNGAQRGEEIFYFKCSFCHIRYAKAELMREIPFAPPLEGLHKQPALMTTVAAKIRAGGLGMPAYRHVLTEADLTDLLAYLFHPDGKCCTDGMEPPLNPRYVNR